MNANNFNQYTQIAVSSQPSALSYDQNGNLDEKTDNQLRRVTS
jgi:YD repeat-containing protein